MIVPELEGIAEASVVELLGIGFRTAEGLVKLRGAPSVFGCGTLGVDFATNSDLSTFLRVCITANLLDRSFGNCDLVGAGFVDLGFVDLGLAISARVEATFVGNGFVWVGRVVLV